MCRFILAAVHRPSLVLKFGVSVVASKNEVVVGVNQANWGRTEIFGELQPMFQTGKFLSKTPFVHF